MTLRRWDLWAGKEIENVRFICEEEVRVVAVSRDSRCVVAGSGDEHQMILGYQWAKPDATYQPGGPLIRVVHRCNMPIVNVPLAH
jgi:hypothetical protein